MIVGLRFLRIHRVTCSRARPWAARSQASRAAREKHSTSSPSMFGWVPTKSVAPSRYVLTTKPARDTSRSGQSAVMRTNASTPGLLRATRTYRERTSFSLSPGCGMATTNESPILDTRSTTRASIDAPPMSARILPGRREPPSRAWITVRITDGLGTRTSGPRTLGAA